MGSLGLDSVSEGPKEGRTAPDPRGAYLDYITLALLGTRQLSV
jgi:hypothetical protein